MQKTIVFDFDGVIHKYRHGWHNGEIYDEPNPQIKDIIRELRKMGYLVVVVSSRCRTPEGIKDIKNYLYKHEIYVDDVCKEKPPATVYIDDRAICFDPESNNLLEQILSFDTYLNKRKEYSNFSSLEALGLAYMKNKIFNEMYQSYENYLEKDPVKAALILDELNNVLKKYKE